MRKRSSLYPPVLEPACPPTHFTVEEARRIVQEIVDEDRRAALARLERMRARRTAAHASAV